MKNKGKVFEIIFKESTPKYCIYHKLPDPPQSFHQNNSLRFSWKNPCDVFLFNTKQRIFYPLELKSTQDKAITFEDITLDKQPSKKIHKHQIESLIGFSQYPYVIAGFIFNFRDEIKNEERTYFQDIKDFMQMIGKINKKSFNEKDLLQFNSLIINGKRKRKNAKYVWDIDTMFNDIQKLGKIDNQIWNNCSL